jgi:hypothetical protein
LSTEDPCTTIKNLLSDVSTGVKLKKDDGITDATVNVADNYADDSFEKYDVVITVGHVNTAETSPFIGLTWKRVIANYSIGLWTHDKTGIAGKRILWDAHREVGRVVGEHATNPGGILKRIRISNRTESPRIDTKGPVFHSIVIVETYRTRLLGDA